MTAVASHSAPLTCDVAIIGLGPVGATLANILGQYGISTIIFERDAAPYHLPRAVAFDDEVMRIFQSIGLAANINEIVEVGAGAHFVDAQGMLLVDWVRSQKISPNGWFVNYRFHQPKLEGILRAGLERFPYITTLLQREVCSLIEKPEGVKVEYKNLETGEFDSAQAAFVIGCDGARSFTRDMIGSGFDDLGFHEPWLVVDLILQKSRPDLGHYSIHHCDPNRPATYVFIGGQRRRWEFRLQPDDDPCQMTQPDHIWHMLSKWVGPNEAILERALVYTFHSSVAKQWQRGRLMIAGDAAHQTPPFMGQGMCAGIRDGFNLGWKLDRILKGQATIDLLRTYQSEREPHVREFISLTVQMGHLINTTASSLVSGSASKTTNGAQKLSQLRPKLGQGLSACRTEWTGHLFPQPRLQTGELLDDRVGRRPAVLMKADFSYQLPTDLKKEMVSADVVAIDDPSPALQGWFSDKNVNAVLMRPDRYILGAAETVDEVRELILAS